MTSEVMITNQGERTHGARRPHPPMTEDERYVDSALRVAWEQIERGETHTLEEVEAELDDVLNEYDKAYNLHRRSKTRFA